MDLFALPVQRYLHDGLWPVQWKTAACSSVNKELLIEGVARAGGGGGSLPLKQRFLPAATSTIAPADIQGWTHQRGIVGDCEF